VCDIYEFAQKGGRPYGGVGVLWKQNSPVKCTVLGHDDLHRCLAVKLECDQFALICVNVYLPTYINSDYYEEDILSCVSYIDSVFSMYVDQQVKFTVIGDFNFDCDRLLSCDRLCVMRNLVQEYNLLNCDDLDCNRLGYTYRHNSLNVISLIDHVFMSESFVCYISNYAVLDSGVNLSDHCVLSITLRYPVVLHLVVYTMKHKMLVNLFHMFGIIMTF
jgi:exonuclease III